MNDCSPYACVEGECTEACNKSDDCAEDGYCQDGTCKDRLSDGAPCSTDEQCQSSYCGGGICAERPASGCAPDGHTLILTDQMNTIEQDCAPYACRDGACVTACGSINDCAPSYICAPSGDRYICMSARDADVEPGSLGCGAGGDQDRGASWIALALGAGLLACRRRGSARSRD